MIHEEPDLSELTPSLSSEALADRNRTAANAAMDRYAAGDDQAFGEVYDAVSPRLYGYLLRQTHDPVRAEDLLQQTMLQLHAMRGRFFPGAEVMPWAYAIARRLLIDSYRRRRREANAFGSGRLTEEPTLPTTEDVLNHKRLAHRIEQELAKLPEAQRVAFELTKKEGLSLREVAEVLGTTVTAIKLRVHRAYVALRAAVGEEVSGDV